MKYKKLKIWYVETVEKNISKLKKFKKIEIPSAEKV